MNFFDKIKRGLSKTRERVFNQLQQLILFSRRIDDELLQKIEELLISADVGVTTSLEIISRVKQEVKRKNYQDSQELLAILKDQILQMFAAGKSLNEGSIERPLVILVDERRLQATGDPELVKDVVRVRLHRLLGDEQP